MKIKIGHKYIGDNCPCFIIAEAGVNHNGDIKLAKKLIDAAKNAGADAVKFQTFTTSGVMTETVPQASYQTKNTAKEETMFAMCKRLELPFDNFVSLKKRCDEKGILFLSTPHSEDAIDFLDPLMPAYKIASGDLTNPPFLKKVALKKKPIILSTGMATLKEVKEAVNTIAKINKKIILLHCTTNYPCPLKEVNLRAMLKLKKEFNLPVGYSDHTEGINVSLAAVAMGACMIEKHFTLDKTLPGPDHKASLEPSELKSLVDGIRSVEKMIQQGEKSDVIIEKLGVGESLGDGIKAPTSSELEVVKVVRKSIVAARNIRKGETIVEDMMAIKRPGTGIEAKYLGRIIGKKAKKDIKKDQLLNWSMV